VIVNGGSLRRRKRKVPIFKQNGTKRWSLYSGIALYSNLNEIEQSSTQKTQT
jgi:hypothetical protein